MDSLGAAPVCAGGGGLVWRVVGGGVGNSDGGVFLQLIKAAVGDNIPGIDAIDLHQAAIRNSRLYAAHVCDVVLNHIHEGCLTILLSGRCWNQGHALQCVHQQPRVHKLVWEERIAFIVEDGSSFHCSCGGVDLVVE